MSSQFLQKIYYIASISHCIFFGNGREKLPALQRTTPPRASYLPSVPAKLSPRELSPPPFVQFVMRQLPRGARMEEGEMIFKNSVYQPPVLSPPVFFPSGRVQW